MLNDLTVLGNYLEIYKETKDNETLKKAFKSIEKSVKLIREMRELEVLANTGSNMTSLNAKEIILKAVNEYKDRGIKFNVKGDCNIIADKAFISVINNIFGNAVTTGKASAIEINMETIKGTCEIRVADNGKGIPDEIKGKLFSEGFSYGETGNTGLGLYIAKKTMERYEGR